MSGTTSYSLADQSSSKKPKRGLLVSDRLLVLVRLVVPGLALVAVSVVAVSAVVAAMEETAVPLVRWVRVRRCVPSVVPRLILVRSVKVVVVTTPSPIARARKRRRRVGQLPKSVSVASGAGTATTTTSRSLFDGGIE